VNCNPGVQNSLILPKVCVLSTAVLLFAYVSGVQGRFTSKLRDTVKEVGSPATLTFSTDDTKPDLKHYLLDGTEVPLVLSGRLSPGTAYSTRNVTIVHREEPHTSYTVTVHIGRVDQQHAGTYVAADHDGLPDSVMNYAQFIVICKH